MMPSYTDFYTLLFSFVLGGFCLEALRRTETGLSKPQKLGLLTLITLWLFGVHMYVSQKLILPEDVSSLGFMAFLVVGVGAVSGLLFLTPIRDKVLSIRQEYLMLIQGLRVFFGMGFLIQGALGIMPLYFGITDGFFHITSAFLALKAGLLLNVKDSGCSGKKGLWTANIFGLSDIAIVVYGLSFYLLKDVGPHHGVMYAALFAAPIFINAHFVSIYKLLTDKK
tara:strand:+ start:2118 stop:2789 length:672 start_codon:yes stop_codon:yes gene_type:complete